MKPLFRSKLAVVAGALLLTGIAQAGVLDGTVLIDRAANNRSLTVRYTGVSAALVELRVRGVSVATRSVSDQQSSGETTFSVDTASLEDGDNPVEIHLYNADGKIVATQKSIITVDRRGTGPIFMEKPSAGSTIQGNVEIKLGLRQDMRDIYVSFFINDEFKSMRNFPPYTYLWNTEEATNGWHEVQAWVVDKMNNTFKTEKLRLFVNNPGGRTNRQGAGAASVTGNNPDPASGAMRGAKAPQLSGSSTAIAGQPVAASAQGLQPTKISVARNQSAALTGNQTTVRAGAMMSPKPAEAAVGLATGHQNLRPSVQAAKPIVTVGSSRTGGATVSAAPEAKLAPVAINYGRRLPNIGTFSVLVDGEFVNFDVSPRVQDGIPLSPFRHLFEQAGGSVYWRHGSKEVQAHRTGTEILFKIGSDIATVNGSQTKFELAPFIESNRVLVPLSFVVDSLKVRVDFDPNTGHVVVTTKESK